MIHDYVIVTRRALAAAALCCGTLLAGCGGGGGGGGGGTPTPFTTPMSLTIDWPDRGRGVSPPSSALSARVVIRAATPTGGDVGFLANRNNNESAHDQTYASTEEGVPGTRTVETQFFTGLDGQGDMVGSATFQGNIRSDGWIDTNVTIDSKIVSVEVPNQHVWIEMSKTLIATARDAQHNAVAVGADAFKWTITAGAENLRYAADRFEGIRRGESKVTAGLDGHVSPAATIQVRATSELLSLGSILEGSVRDMSADGTVLIGGSNGTAFRWSQSTGMQVLADPQSTETYRVATGVSADGSTIVGYCSKSVNATKQAWVWQNGQWSYPHFEASTTATLEAVSRNGERFAGIFGPNLAPIAFVWRVGEDGEVLGLSPGATRSYAQAISDDGLTVAGVQEVGARRVATIWRDGVPQLLPVPIDITSSEVTDISADGRVVVGHFTTATSTRGFYWSSATGLVQVRPDGVKDVVAAVTGNGDWQLASFSNSTYLRTSGGEYETLSHYSNRNFGLLVDGNTTKFPVAISDDGRTIAGADWLLRPVATD